MKVYVVYREYVGWEDYDTNGGEITGAFDTLEKAQKEMEKIYQQELMFFHEEECEIQNEMKGNKYIELLTERGDVRVYISTQEVK